MKHLVLVFLLVLFSGHCAFGQDSKAEKIVNMALKKHTSGKFLKQYEVRAEYGKPGKAPIHLIYSEQALHFLDSIRLSVPDSIREIIEQSMVKADLERSAFMEEILGIHNVENYVDLTSFQAAKIDISPNKLKGRNDTTRSVYDFRDKDIPADFRDNNPVAFLQFMAAHLAELRYKETDDLDNVGYDIIQVKEGGILHEAYFDKKSHLLKRVINPQISNDPLIGKGIMQHKTIFCFNSYQNRSGFLLPDSLEVINSRLPYTSKKGLHWISINKPLPVAVFYPVPSEEDLIQYSISEIGTDLYVMEQKGDYVNRRSLIKRSSNNGILLFSEFTNSDSSNKKQMNTLKSKFSGAQISNIFSVENVSGFVSLAPFFSEQTHLYEPKAATFPDEEKIRLYENPQEDSMRQALYQKGQLTILDAEIKVNDVISYTFNPVRENRFASVSVIYYLPKEKVIYFNGNAYSADRSGKNAYPKEKLLYDVIKSRSLEVDKIVYTGAFMDNAPLFMTFQDFETRIKNTDFSIYEEEKK